MEEQNPEKIPMNPIQEPVADRQLYEAPVVEQVSGRKQVMKGMFKRPKQEPAMPLKYQLFLAALMITFLLAAFIVGRILFRNGLI